MSAKQEEFLGTALRNDFFVFLIKLSIISMQYIFIVWIPASKGYALRDNSKFSRKT